MRTTGQFITTTVAGEAVRAFVPHPLPPSKPSVSLEGTLVARLHAAESAISRLAIAGPWSRRWTGSYASGPGLLVTR